MKKGQIWVSAALYIALGIIVITVVLSAGLPLINKIQAKNTLLQTKKVMYQLDETARGVMLQGAGSKIKTFVEIKKGELTIDPITDNKKRIIWTSLSKYNPGIEEGATITEGDLEIKNIKKGSEYEVSIILDLTGFLGDAGLRYDGEETKKTIMGSYNLVIEHVRKIESEGGQYLNIREV
ncbi:unnamed protein product [marine sediment metagenome]|uniref:Uncharacterized protein n=1 Tax=marine sediment metagenome TaxID=412755 RepID=X0SMX5_9ZZZZ